jgi:hypothetical protein
MTREALIEVGREIDEDAANYLADGARTLKSYDEGASTLVGMFVFCESPQGHDYWWGIKTAIDNVN